MIKDWDKEIIEIIDSFKNKGVELWTEDGKIRYKAEKGVLGKNDFDVLKNNKEKIIAVLEKNSNLKQVSNEDNKYESFKLTDIQSAYLLGRREYFDYGGVACHIYLEVNYEDLDYKKSERVWNKLINRHEMLRAVINDDGTQKFLEEVPYFNVKYKDLSQVNPEEELSLIRKDMGNRKYDINKWPMYDIAITKTREASIMHLSIEFLIADWASIWILLKEFDDLYENEQAVLSKLTFNFKDYLAKEDALKNDSKYLEDKSYWMNRIDNIPLAPELPIKPKDEVVNEFIRHFFILDTKDWSILKKKALEKGLTPTAVVMTAFASCIEKWSTNKRFALNLTLLNRLPLDSQVNDIVGDFTSVNLLEVNLEEEKSFKLQAEQVQKQLFKDLDHRTFSGVEVLREITRKRGKEAALMPIVFTSAIGLVQNKNLKGKISGYGISQTPQVFIDCQVMDNENGLRVNWDVRKGVFDERMIEDMFDSFKELMYDLVNSDDSWNKEEVVTLPKWQLEERNFANATKGDIPELTLHEMILNRIELSPEKIAVVDKDEKITYKELGNRAAAIASELYKNGCKARDRVAIIMNKSVHQVEAVLGILSLGATYVPIDIKQPMERILTILEQGKIKFAVTASKIDSVIREKTCVIESTSLEPQSWETDIVKGNLKDPAYVIYTSGSTGVPKGVVITHIAAANTINDINKKFNVNSKDSILGLAQLHFDLSVYDIFGLLSVGGTVIYPNIDEFTNPSHWVDLIKEYNITLWNSVPALMQMLVSYLESEKDVTGLNLRLALLSGDWIPLNLPDKLISLVKDIKLVSLGGATEASIWSNYYIYNGLKEGCKSIPYGYPLTNQGFKVLDCKMRDCPVLVPGELYITGLGLAEGYIGDEKKTKEQFLTDPYTNERIYKTGDYGCYRENGEIEFLGRKDTQVKINGHRIELGEVEAALLKHNAVSEAAVVIREGEREKGLLAIVKPKEKEEFDIKEKELEGIINNASKLAKDIECNSSESQIEEAIKYRDMASLHSILFALESIGIFKEDRGYSLEEIKSNNKISDNNKWLMDYWVSRLEKENFIERLEFNKYKCNEKITREMLDKEWKKAEELWLEDMGSKKFIEYMKENSLKLVDLLSGKENPVSLLYPEGKLDVLKAIYFDNNIANYLNRCICEIVKSKAKANPYKTIKILEIGAGTGATSKKVLETVKDYKVEYLFTDVANNFITNAKAAFTSYKNVKYKLFNMDNDFHEQGLSSNSFDIVIAAGVLENAKYINNAFKSIEELIKPEGLLLFTEPSIEEPWILMSQAFMMTKPEDDLRKDTTYIDEDTWKEILKGYGGNAPIVTLPEENNKLSKFRIKLFIKKFKSHKMSLEEEEVKEFVKRYVPEYMVPLNIEVVDNIPLTQNGKVNRKEICKWNIEREEEVIAEDIDNRESASELELKVIKLWEDSLGIQNISRSRNLYEYGVDSLVMAQVAGKLKELACDEVSDDVVSFDEILHQILNFPTIERLTEFLNDKINVKTKINKEDENESTSKGIFTNFGGGTEGPLRVVFHAGLGTMNLFKYLLKHLDKQNLGPVIGISLRDVDEYCSMNPEDVIETLADDYSDKIIEMGYEKVQLIGYSLGGLIAVEVARRLVEREIEIVDLSLIDAYPVPNDIQDDLALETIFMPNLNIGIQDVYKNISEDDFKKAICYVLENNDGNVPKDSLIKLRDNDEFKVLAEEFYKYSNLTEKERFEIYANAAKEATGEEMSSKMAESLFNINKQSFKAAVFVPDIYLGDSRYLVAKETPELTLATQEMALSFWEDVCIGDFEVIEIEGNHIDCIGIEQNAIKVAEILGKVL
ncbi:MAG: amino acid adenylation domain-containing protein [Clostridium sp.]|nr:amino acid adenylation domain-containing protein [Clostridium sp.]